MVHNIKTLLTHVIIWIIYWGVEFVIVYLTYNTLNLVEIIPNSIINTVQFYLILYYIFPQRSIVINWSIIILKTCFLFLIYIGLKAGLTYILESSNWLTIYSLNKIDMFLIGNSYRFLIFSVYAGFIWFFTTRNKLSKILLEKELQEEKLKNTLLLAQQSALIAKINPHFLFNTLSFLYSKSVTSSDEIVSKTILLLSDVFRYSLNNNESQLIHINDEVEHIKKLIKINKLRFNNKFYFNITNIGEKLNKQIPPFILLTLFENALKHGDFQDSKKPISLSIEQLFNRIIIHTSNTKKKNSISETESFNIGLNYVESILTSIYEKNCTLQIENLKESYTLKLTIITND